MVKKEPSSPPPAAAPNAVAVAEAVAALAEALEEAETHAASAGATAPVAKRRGRPPLPAGERLKRLEEQDARRKAKRDADRLVKRSQRPGSSASGGTPRLMLGGGPGDAGASSSGRSNPPAGQGEPSIPPVIRYPLPSLVPREDPRWPPQEFLIHVNGDPRGRFPLPPSFTSLFSAHMIAYFKLWVDGCDNGPIFAEVAYTVDGEMYIKRGWGTFIRCHGFGYVSDLHVVYDGWWTLTLKVFNRAGLAAACCLESESEDSSEDGQE